MSRVPEERTAAIQDLARDRDDGRALFAVAADLALFEDEGVVVAAVEDLPGAERDAIVALFQLILQDTDQRFEFFSSHGSPIRRAAGR